MPSPQRSLGHSLFKQKFSQKFLCFFVLFCFFVFCVFYFIKISKFALPGVMLIYERTSKDRKKERLYSDSWQHIINYRQEKLRPVVHRQEAFYSIYWKYKWWKFSISYYFVSYNCKSSALTQIYSDFSAKSAASLLSPHYRQEEFHTPRSSQNQQDGYIGVLKKNFKVLSNTFTC